MPDLEEEIIIDGDSHPLEGGKEEDQGPEFSEVEQDAMSKGWSPDGVEGKPNLSAEEFVARQPLYDKLHKTDRAMKRVEDQNKAVTAHLEMMRKSLAEDKVENLKARKKEVLAEQDDGWTDEVIAIDEKIIKASQEEEIVVAEVVDNSAYDVWLERNQWYENNNDMKAYADRLGAGILAQSPSMDLKDVYQEVEDEVKLRFSDKFKPVSRQSPVDSGRPRSRQKDAKYTVADLDEETKGIMGNLVRSGVMTAEEYLTDLESTGYFN